jgi:hypothetical protein
VPELHVLRGPRIPETVGHPFLCEHFHGTLMGGECLRRQTTRTRRNPLAKDQTERVPAHLEYCASGECEQGAAIAKKFPTWKPDQRPRPVWKAQVDAAMETKVAAPTTKVVAPAPVEQLKREVADAVLSMKKPSWREWKAAKERERAQRPPPEPVEHYPHPLSNRGMEEQAMAEKACSESGCARPAITKGLCGMHYQRARNAQKGAKRSRRAPPHTRPALNGQDEFDLMIRIRDDFRRLSPDGQRYVLAALKG